VRNLPLAVLLAASGCLSGCDSNPSKKYEGLSPAELHARVKALPLQERYAMYLDVYDDRTPRNPMLASDLVELGQPARTYAITRTSTADAKEFGAILSLLSHFNHPCTADEKALLTASAERLDSGREALDASKDWIEVACSES
jgi:hypothetical protein